MNNVAEDTKEYREENLSNQPKERIRRTKCVVFFSFLLNLKATIWTLTIHGPHFYSEK
jgi:hypothetical protein